MRPPARGALLVLVVLTIFGALSARPVAAAECQYAHVVDPCSKALLILGVEPPSLEHGIPLGQDEVGQCEPGGVDFSTVPGYAADYSFVTQGWFLRVIRQTAAEPWRTLDLRGIAGLSDLWLLNLEAAAPIPLEGENRYPLYAVGARSGQPWLVVFDQGALLAETLDPAALVLASGPVCVDGVDCAGVGVDVAVSGSLDGDGSQEAYASVLNITGGLGYQRFYRVDLHADATFDVVFDFWNEEGEPFSASAPLALGVDYDGGGLQPFGIFQTSSVVADLDDRTASCALPGDPTDVAVWGPDSDLKHPYFHFVTSSDPSGPDLLLGFPAGGCPYDDGGYLVLPVGGLPHAVAVSSDTSTTPWVFTANKEQGISAVHLSISSEGGVDLVEVLGDSVPHIDLEGCPARLSIRDEAYTSCPFLYGEPKPPKVDCLVDPDDPRCVDRDNKMPVEFGEN